MRISLSRYILLAKKWAWLVVVGVVICGVGTFAVSKLFIKPTYKASASIVVTLQTSSSPSDNATAALTLLPTYIELVTNPTVLQPVVSKYHMQSANELASKISVKQIGGTQVIEVTVSDEDPKMATNITNDVAQNFAQYQNTQLGGVSQLRVVPAIEPTRPSKPQPTQDAIVGALVGFGLAIALIVVFEWLDDRVPNPEEMQKLLEADALTIIPELSKNQQGKNAEDTPELAEGCRVLCSNIATAQTQQPFKLIMLTSALAGEGKSTIAANLATFLAMSGKRVLLVDADLRNPVLDKHFHINNQNGLAQILMGVWGNNEMALDGIPTEIPTLRLMPAGTRPQNPAELLISDTARRLFKHYQDTNRFDYVIFDTPPLLPVADAQIVASYAEVSVLVVAASRSPRRLLNRAMQILRRTGTRVLGLAINRSQWPEYGDIHDYRGSVQTQGAPLLKAAPAAQQRVPQQASPVANQPQMQPAQMQPMQQMQPGHQMAPNSPSMMPNAPSMAPGSAPMMPPLNGSRGLLSQQQPQQNNQRR
uniref:non-specific protein-tyrosine kinase n=1 Tax=Thermosporothrix sp. COM3 TaxID=2490863 RepID=A0A455STY5_9CHLR|nr:hypothetical protein KTC_33650 [Thermosporothrix sp. COM3]